MTFLKDEEIFAPSPSNLNTTDNNSQTENIDSKNYLNDEEMNYLERIVSVYLDFAELQTERKIPMSMEDWARRLDGFLEFNGNEILTGAGKISHEQAKLYAETEYEKYRIVQDALFQSDFDRFVSDVKEIEKAD